MNNKEAATGTAANRTRSSVFKSRESPGTRRGGLSILLDLTDSPSDVRTRNGIAQLDWAHARAAGEQKRCDQ